MPARLDLVIRHVCGHDHAYNLQRIAPADRPEHRRRLAERRCPECEHAASLAGLDAWEAEWRVPTLSSPPGEREPWGKELGIARRARRELVRGAIPVYHEIHTGIWRCYIRRRYTAQERDARFALLSQAWGAFAGQRSAAWWLKHSRDAPGTLLAHFYRRRLDHNAAALAQLGTQRGPRPRQEAG